MSLTPEQIDRAFALASKSAANCDYFLQRLSTPQWIDPLANRGFFKKPPGPIESADGVRVPGWLPSQYLARVAASDPAKVADVIQKIETDNERIHEDFSEAATAMPGRDAECVAKREVKWLRGQPEIYFGLYEKHAALVCHLVDENRIDTAFSLARELLRVQRNSEEDTTPWLQRWRGRFSDWSYGEVLGQVVPALLGAAPKRALELVLELLAQVVAHEPPDEPPWATDYFRVWRPRLENEEHGTNDVAQSLLSAVRDAAVRVRTEALLPTSQLLDILLACDSRLFNRLACYALAAPPPAEPADLRRVLLNHDALSEGEPSPEYRALLTRDFHRLSAADRRQLLKMIQAGPPLVTEAPSAVGNVSESEEKADVWRIRRLVLIADDLPKAWRSRYETLVEKYGRHEIGTSFEIRTHVGPTSPMTLDELRALSDEALVAELATYEADDSFFGPSREGLARALSTLAEEEPERLCRLVPHLPSLRPVYVSWSLHGLEEAVRKGRKVDWHELADLFEAVIDRTDDGSIGSREDFEDGRWREVRKAMADLLELAFDGRHDGAPISLRHRLWALLETLTDDPEPDSEYEATYGGDNMDPATLALNTVRGRAMQAVVAYAMWVMRNCEDEAGSTTDGFLTEVPEVQRILEAHLDAERDSSVAVRSVYGHYFPWIVLIDEEWVTGLVPRIFPSDLELQPLRLAAWEAYLVWNRAYDSCLKVLRGEYEWAVAEPEAPAVWAWHGTMDGPRVGLAKHLLTFYWRGLIDIEGPDGLLPEFYLRASDHVRSRAMMGVGHGFEKAVEVEDAVVTRLTAFWEWRLREVGSAAGMAESEELAAFAWWLPCECFSLEWRLSQLETLVAGGCRPDLPTHAYTILNRLAADQPLRVVETLRALCGLESQRWGISGSRETIAETLRTLLSTDEVVARDKARDLVHWLGSLGHSEFRGLLPPEKEQG